MVGVYVKVGGVVEASAGGSAAREQSYTKSARSAHGRIHRETEHPLSRVVLLATLRLLPASCGCV